MKYTITNPESEQRLATVDHLESRLGSDWQVALLDEKNSETKCQFKGACVTLEEDSLEVTLADGARTRFPFTRNPIDGSLTVATELGTLRLLASRGVLNEAAAGARLGSKSIKSSMPGKILKLLCKPGDRIESGQPLLIIEAMKMENEIRSPQAGIVEELPVQIGQSIQTGELLVKIVKGE